jgi:hypothetical protein
MCKYRKISPRYLGLDPPLGHILLYCLWSWCGCSVVTSATAGTHKSGSKVVVPATAQLHANRKKTLKSGPCA